MAEIITNGEATALLPLPGTELKPITVIGTEAIRRSFDEKCLQQAINSRLSPGVSDLVLNPDAHAGYGAPVGCVMASPSHIYPGPVGVDIKCSMSLLQTDIPEEELKSREVRRAVIRALLTRLPTGPGRGQRNVKSGRRITLSQGRRFVIEGASEWACRELGIPYEWTAACEDSFHRGHDDSEGSLEARLALHERERGADFIFEKLQQLGSYGGGNHFGEAEAVQIIPEARSIAENFGLLDGRIAFMSHCGSRGFGYFLAQSQFRALQLRFAQKQIAFPGGDKELVYAELGTPEADCYLDDMALGGNFATLNHLLINALVLEAFQEVMPGARGSLIYFISHNIARREQLHGSPHWVHRKGATRAFPAGHPALKGTRYQSVGHPILLPGNPAAGSVVMVAEPGAALSCYSVNHGAGRSMSRTRAIKELNQRQIDDQLDRGDILSNCRNYPRDEAPAAYKNFGEVVSSVEKAGLARSVARLTARFVIKDSDQSNGGAA